MDQLPLHISIFFAATTLLTVYFLYRAAHNDSRVLIILIAWLLLQAVVALSGFYTVTAGFPPRFILLALPAMLFIVALFVTKGGRRFLDKLDIKTLTLLHVVRLPVELTLYALCMFEVVPAVMTFEGRNFDILAGISAPIVWYFGFVKNTLSRRFLIAWNIICILLLINIVSTAILSMPFSFQQLAFDRPNIALMYFPFVWLPCCVVPVVLLAHLVSLRKLLR